METSILVFPQCHFRLILPEFDLRTGGFYGVFLALEVNVASAALENAVSSTFCLLTLSALCLSRTLRSHCMSSRVVRIHQYGLKLAPRVEFG